PMFLMNCCFLLAAYILLLPPITLGSSALDRLGNFTLSAKILTDSVCLNDPFVEIECRVTMIDNSTTTRIFAVMWSKGNTILAENGISYSTSNKHTFVMNDAPKNSTVFIMRINHVTWSDLAEYSCHSVNAAFNVLLNATAPPRRVESFVAASTASAEVTGAPSKVGPRSNSSSGSRRSPLRLGRSDGLTLTCRTSCGAAVSAASRRPPVRVGFQRLDRIGLPPSGLSFDVEALQSPDLLLESVSDTRVGHCDAGCRASSANDSVSWITWTEVTVRMDNCSQLALDGRTRFYCQTESDLMELFVHCPMVYRDFPPTRSEIAAASAGSVLGLALVALGFVIFCRSCDCGGGSKSQEESGASTVNV
ncbi:hypothetical protein BOX15_Mlig023071g1, partial [Macrostomum lignano]